MPFSLQLLSHIFLWVVFPGENTQRWHVILALPYRRDNISPEGIHLPWSLAHPILMQTNHTQGKNRQMSDINNNQ